MHNPVERHTQARRQVEDIVPVPTSGRDAGVCFAGQILQLSFRLESIPYPGYVRFLPESPCQPPFSIELLRTLGAIGC